MFNWQLFNLSHMLTLKPGQPLRPATAFGLTTLTTFHVLIQTTTENSVPRSGHPLATFTPWSKPQWSKPQLIQTMNSEGCNNFLTPWQLSPLYPSHNWSKPWILKDVIISPNPWQHFMSWSKPQRRIVFREAVTPWRLSPLDPNHN